MSFNTMELQHDGATSRWSFNTRALCDYSRKLHCKNNIRSVLNKVGVAAVVYNIWSEKNIRIFQDGKRDEDTLIMIVKNEIKWKLASLKVKKSIAVTKVFEEWGVCNEVIWEDLRGNTRDLDSILEETGQDCNFTRSGFKDARIVPGDGVAIPKDDVRTYKRRRQELCDGVRT
ncbi:hypothetical protein Tco_1456323 [Tanacetum coccineum]